MGWVIVQIQLVKKMEGMQLGSKEKISLIIWLNTHPCGITMKLENKLQILFVVSLL